MKPKDVAAVLESSIDELCINALRALAIDAIEEANSGHPGLPLGAAPMAYVLWARHLRHDPEQPRWADRDRFVLSPGHGSMLLYGLLHLCGYDLTVDDLRAFRQQGSRTPGHPEFGETAGVEATTGPLGQGTANAVGMALAERSLGHRFNRPGHTIVDHMTFALVSDGDLMEGLSGEAASLAGHLGLGKLVYLYDANDVTLDGPADLTFTEDVARRYEAYGWQVLRVEDGDRDLVGIHKAIIEARDERQKPSLIVVRTTIGFGAPKKAGTAASHGAPLGADEARATKQALGWSAQPFEVPPAVVERFAEVRSRGCALSQAWTERFEAYARDYPDLAREFRRVRGGSLPDGFDDGLPTWETGAKAATRSAGGKVLAALAERVPELLGGDADLGCSTKTLLPDGGDFDGRTGAGRNLHFGVREHAMAAIANGMAYHGGVRPYTATFFVFSDYMRPSVRVAALARLPVVHVWTHDSVAVGEDGPTHQPIEHLASLRAMPNLHVLRPADARETAAAWRQALLRTDGPTGLVLSRQDLSVLAETEDRADDGVARGAYVLAEADGGTPEVLLLATGSEVWVALEARERLAADGVRARVVSMPCWEAFAEQDAAYRDEVLPPDVPLRVSLEAGVTMGWERWVGAGGRALGIDRFGASAPGSQNLEAYGMTAAAVVEAVRDLRAARGS